MPFTAVLKLVIWYSHLVINASRSFISFCWMEYAPLRLSTWLFWSMTFSRRFPEYWLLSLASDTRYWLWSVFILVLPSTESVFHRHWYSMFMSCPALVLLFTRFSSWILIHSIDTFAWSVSMLTVWGLIGLFVIGIIMILLSHPWSAALYLSAARKSFRLSSSQLIFSELRGAIAFSY